MEPTDLTAWRSRHRAAAWRVGIGQVLRGVRHDQGLRLADVASLAGMSPQYLSEVERGRKEASSQVLAALTRALGLSLVDLAGALARELPRGSGEHGVAGTSAGTGLTDVGAPGRRPPPGASVSGDHVPTGLFAPVGLQVGGRRVVGGAPSGGTTAVVLLSA